MLADRTKNHLELRVGKHTGQGHDPRSKRRLPSLSSGQQVVDGTGIERQITSPVCRRQRKISQRNRSTGCDEREVQIIEFVPGVTDRSTTSEHLVAASHVELAQQPIKSEGLVVILADFNKLGSDVNLLLDLFDLRLMALDPGGNVIPASSNTTFAVGRTASVVPPPPPPPRSAKGSSLTPPPPSPPAFRKPGGTRKTWVKRSSLTSVIGMMTTALDSTLNFRRASSVV